MKSSYLRSFCVVLGLLGISVPLSAAEPFGSASLLPMPSAQDTLPAYPLVSHTSYGQGPEELSPSDQAAPFTPPPAPVVSQDYQQAMKQSWDNAGAGSYGPTLGAACGRPCPRFALYGGGLILRRADSCDHPLSLDAGTLQNVMGTDDARQRTAGGFEVGGAWIMPNCCNAISVGYWGLFPSDQMAYVNAANYSGGLRPVLGNVDRLSYNDGTTTDNVFNWMTTGTGTHYVSTSSSFNSVEINFLGNTTAWGLTPYGAGCNSCNSCNSCGPQRWQFGWLAGFRYFSFNESLTMRTDENDTVIGQVGDTDELTYRINATNSLTGFQMGGQGAWYYNNCFSFYGAGRFGVYNNHVQSNQYISGTGGDAYINAGSYSGDAWRYSNTRNGLAGVGQLDLGTRYQMGCHWSIYGGYRLVGLAGVATSASQIPQNFGNPRNSICANDSVLLHGTFLGAQYAW